MTKLHNNGPAPAASTAPATSAVQPLEVREGERPRTWFRAGRVFWRNGQYYIATREGIDVGPYDSPREAEQDATRLVELLSETDDPVRARLTIIEFNNRS